MLLHGLFGKKIMVIPSSREKELQGLRDPSFLELFHNNNWRYTTYEVINRLTSYSKTTVYEISQVAKNL